MKKYCANCNKDVKTDVRIVSEENIVKGDCIDNVPVELVFCKECNEIIYDFEFEQKATIKIYDEYRKRHKLLTSKEIKDICIQYRMSPKKMASVLGFGDNTIYRYLNGTIQDKAQDVLLKIAQSPVFFMWYIQNNEVNIPKKELDKLMDLLLKLSLNQIKILINQVNVEERKEKIATQQIKYKYKSDVPLGGPKDEQCYA